MLDRAARRLIDPGLEAIAGRAARLHVSANQVTLLGFVLGLGAIACIAAGLYLPGLALLLLNRLADGVDGCLARRHGATDLGGYLDIVLDFIVYSGLGFAFALAQPENAVAAAFLIFSFMGTGASFLAFAIFAAKRKLGEHQGLKGFYYLGGITEGTETILLFVVVCLLPGYFAGAAYVFGALCWLTTIGRIGAAVQRLR